MHRLKKIKISTNESNLWYEKLEKPSWLISKLSSDIWVLERQVEGVQQSTYIINWKPSDNVIISEETRYWIEKAKEITYFYMESDKTNCNRTTSLALVGREYLSIFKWFNNERLCQKISDITSSDIKAYEGYLTNKNISFSTVNLKLILLRGVWKLRNVLNEGIDFDPYPKHGSLKKASASIGHPNSHTKTIFPKQLFKLINHSISKIENSSEILMLMETYLKLKNKNEINLNNLHTKFQKCTGESSKAMMNNVNILYGAALLIIFTLTGDRKHQISSISYDDVEDILNKNSEELIGKVTKTAHTSTGKITKTPVIKELVDALKIVKKITQYKRQNYDGKLFFLKQPFKHNAPQNSYIPLTTSNYYMLLDKLLTDSDCDIKILRPHMFRKAFSMMWAWRFEFGDLHYLSRMLHHNSDHFTKIYTNDEHAFSFWSEEMKELMYDVMEEVLVGDEELSGGFGKTMKRYRRLLNASVSVITPQEITNYVSGIANKHDYKMIPQSDGMCFISNSRAKYAKCSTDGMGPNYINRNEEHCTSCVNFGVLENRTSVWERRLDAHERVYNLTEIPVIRESSKLAIARANKILEQLRSK